MPTDDSMIRNALLAFVDALCHEHKDDYDDEHAGITVGQLEYGLCVLLYEGHLLAKADDHTLHAEIVDTFLATYKAQ